MTDYPGCKVWSDDTDIEAEFDEYNDRLADRIEMQIEVDRAVSFLKLIFGNRWDGAINNVLVDAKVIHESMQRSKLSAMKKDNPQ